MIKIKCDKIIAPGGLFDGFVYIGNGKISSVSTADMPTDKSYDLTGKYVSPGFIDIHTHGAGGYDFLTDDAKDVIRGTSFHLAHGTTSILPTVSAAPLPKMKSALCSIAKAMDSGKSAANIIGAHLEGPYLSKNQSGAQCADYITPPVREEYEDMVRCFGAYIKRWTYAPENDKDGEFAGFITKNGIIASAGHTDAILSDMSIAKENGMKLVTHLYSCTSTVTRDRGFRQLGVIETAFLWDDIFVEIIADGKHLPAELIKMIIKIKGTDKVALITDSLEIAGTDTLSGVMSGTEFIVEDGVCKLRDRSAFAGSVATADKLIRVVTGDVMLPLPTAVKMISKVPAEILGLNKGVIKEGFDADVIVFDEKINVSSVFVGGRKVI